MNPFLLKLGKIDFFSFFFFLYLTQSLTQYKFLEHPCLNPGSPETTRIFVVLLYYIVHALGAGQSEASDEGEL